MILWVIRLAFIVLALSLLSLAVLEDGPFKEIPAPLGLTLCLAMLVFGLVIDVLIPRKRLNELAGIFFGLMVGLVFALACTRIVDALYQSYDFAIPQEGIRWVITVLCCYVAIVFVIRTKDDFRFIIPYVQFSKQTKGNFPYILDTSVIIDGRIADIAATGFLHAPMVIPRFVLDELQNIADSPDRLRRNRGRRGLDMLNKMQTNKQLDLRIEDVHLPAEEQGQPVDLKLVATAVQVNGRVVTNDYNLNKVARLRGVKVLNINDLANAIKPILLPGETLRTKMVKPGDQPGQGVGYMSDGTMIVAEQGRQFIGKEVPVMVTSVLQTSAGRMVFGKID